MSGRIKSKVGSERRIVEVKSVTSKNGELKALIKEIGNVIAKSHPGRGVDSLVAQPFVSARMGADVGRAVGRTSPAEWNTFTHELGLFEIKYGPIITVINDVCRAAINGRKRKLLVCGAKPAKREARS